MGTTAEKIEYLNETKELIKQSLNDLGADIEDSNSFRSYVQKINTLYEDWPKITEEGTFLSLNSTQKGKMKIELKGNTLQDGEPSPDSPVDVNVVSGSNVIKTSSKNFNDGINRQIFISANVNQCNIYTGNIGTYLKIPEETYTISTSITQTKYRVACTNTIPGSSLITCYNGVNKDNTKNNITINTQGYKYLLIDATDITKIQVEKDSTATTYEPHQGKELPLDLPVENLLDNIFNQGGVDFGGTGQSTGASNRINTNLIPVKPNTTYTVSNFNSNIYQFGIGLYKSDETYDSNHKINNGGWNNFPYTFTTQNDTYYVKIAFKNANDTTLSPTGDYKTMLNKGSLANAYTPYGVAPIELCKIGDYQDYFYKNNGKWYLHKEVEKATLDGSEDWYLRNQGDGNTTISFTHYLTNLGGFSNIICTSFIQDNISSNGIEGIGVSSGLTDIFLEIKRDKLSSLDANGLKMWLSNNNMIVYYIATPTNTEITDTTLINQLEAIYNAISYKEQTNILQENNNLPFILNVSALQKE